MTDIVIFTIGPVQSFIAAARRTQDLWAGSRLLSDIMKPALDAAPREGILFPYRGAAGEWPDSLPNRAVILTPEGQGKATAEAMATAARGRWTTTATAVHDWFARRVENTFTPAADWDWREIWDRQVKDWLEVYWVVYPWDEAAEGYGAAYRRAGELLDARKLTRHFPDHREYDVKSTLDGTYQALRGRKEGKPHGAAAFWERAAHVAPRGDVRRGERLSAIDLIKRFAQDAGILFDDKTRFPSTSSIACADYRLALMTCWGGKADKPGVPGTGQAVTEFVAALDKLVDAFPGEGQNERLRFSSSSHEPFPTLQKAAANNPTLFQLGRDDGDYFYPDFYTEARFVEQLGRDRGATLTESELAAIGDAKSALLALYAAGDALDIPRPALYYAVIALDGDRIGRKLSGPGATEDHHRSAGRAMDTFARQDVRAVAGHDYPALWVYAGGDDALVLSPISCALAVADGLRQAFARTVGAALDEFNPDEPATASAGIAIVHQQSPLQLGIRGAKAAEEAAKNAPYGRDALVVHRQTRGGAPQQLGSKWDVGHNGDRQAITGLVTELQSFFAGGRISGKFAYELQEEAPALAGVARPGQEAEMERIMSRHTPKKDDRPAIKPLALKLAELSAAFGKDGIVQVAEWAVLARFLATGGRRS